MGTPYIFTIVVSGEFLSREQAKGVVKDMVSSGWRCNVETYAKIMELIDKIQGCSRGKYNEDLLKRQHKLHIFDIAEGFISVTDVKHYI